MGKNISMLIKIVVVVFIFLLLWLIFRPERGLDEIIDEIFIDMGTPAPEGEYARVEDVVIIANALSSEATHNEILYNLTERYQINNDARLKYDDFIKICTALGILEEERFTDKYLPEHYFLKEDWEAAANEMIAIYNKQPDADLILEVTVKVLGMEDDVIGPDGKAGENYLLNREMEIIGFKSSLFRDYPYQTVKALSQNEELLVLTDIVNEDMKLKNVFFLGEDEGRIGYFYRNFEIHYRREGFGTESGISADVNENEDIEGNEISLLSELISDYTIGDIVKEQLADLDFNAGVLREINFKSDVISGKLLAAGDNEITIEGHGVFEITDEMQVYRLFDKMKTMTPREMAIGYDFTDFVIEDGKICGALMVRNEAMDYIRVALRTDNFAGLYHQEVRLTADVDFTVIHGAYDARQIYEYTAGEVLTFYPDSDMLISGSVIISPNAGTGRITVSSLKRSQGIPAYRGNIEIKKAGDGMALINEVLLEEYLYSVVPSEMPASYPLEALKAQAICARTYSYRFLQRSGLSALGAHVDDSVAYQVYNNIAENMNTTKAVKETAGKMLFFQDKLAATYYYSTSSGNATVVEIWKGSTGEDTSYLRAAILGDDRHVLTGAVNGGAAVLAPEMLVDDDIFREFISSVRESDYESAEPWYRWQYEVTDINNTKIGENIKRRYNANYRLVQTLERGEYVSKPITDVGDVTNIYGVKRLPGGVMDELIIETTKNSFKIISENTIRHVLFDNDFSVIRQDGSIISTLSILPSAFMVIDPVIKDGLVSGYKITGGGFGHGVGMAQNGARALGYIGYTYVEILDVFYGDCEVRTLSTS